MNKAAFKALREHAGLSHAAIVDMLDVNERSVKRWEDPRYSDPPEDACRISVRLGIYSSRWRIASSSRPRRRPFRPSV